jgi:hypothetical protein
MVVQLSMHAKQNLKSHDEPSVHEIKSKYNLIDIKIVYGFARSECIEDKNNNNK